MKDRISRIRDRIRRNTELEDEPAPSRPDPNAELVLARYDVPTLHQTCYIADIDWKASLANQARITDPLDSQRVRRYAACMARGDVFTEVVLLKYDSPMAHKGYFYKVLGGNHRVAARKKNGETVVRAYIVPETDVKTTDKIQRELNCLEGQPTSLEDRYTHAINAVSHYKENQEKAARDQGLTKSQLNEEMRYRQRRSEFEAAGIRIETANGKDKSIIRKISTIYNKKVCRAIGLLVSDLNLHTGIVDDLVKAVKAANGSEQEMLDLIDAQRQTLERGSRKKQVGRRNSPASIFFGFLTRAETVTRGKDSLVQFGITDIELLRATAKRVDALAKTLRKYATDAKREINGR